MKSGIIKWILGIVVLIVTLFLIFFVWLWIGFQGGIDNMRRNAVPDVNPFDKSVIQKREAVVNEINGSFVEIGSLLPFKEYATSTHDRCHRGDNNWKRSDFYSNHCGYRITKFYGLNGNFKQSMLDFEKQLYSRGWSKPEYDTNNPMESLMKYYDRNYGTKLLHGEGLYDISYLPSSVVDYTKGGQKFRIEFAEKATTNIKDIEYTQNENSGIAAAEETYEVKNLVNIQEVLNQVTNNYRYLIVISIQKEYFEN